MRFNAQTATPEWFVYVPHEASRLDEYTNEIKTFPGGKYDDQAEEVVNGGLA
jgi:phage terminase large subunit-like protein